MSNPTNNLFEAALGFVTMANEAWEKNIDDLAEKGKFSREEGEDLINMLEDKIIEGQKQFELAAANIYKAYAENKNTVIPDPTTLLQERVKSLELKVHLLVQEITDLQGIIKKNQPSKRVALKKKPVKIANRSLFKEMV